MTTINKYAHALFNAAKESKELELVYSDYDAFMKALKGQKAWLYYASISDLKDTIKKIDKLDFQTTTFPNFLKTIVQDGMGYYLKKIQKRFYMIADDYLNIAFVSVEVPQELPEDEKKKLEKNFRDFFGDKKVVIRYQINKDIISGMRVSHSGMQVDSTIGKRLQNMFFEIGD